MVSCGFLIFLSAMSIHLFLTTAQQPIYRSHSCLDASQYTANTTFKKNLELTLTSLYAKAEATRSSRFYNTSTGQNPNTAYGLFLCRADIPPDLCRSCIKTTTEEIISLCPYQKEAIIWYDMCMLRYSNRSIFARMEESPNGYARNWNLIQDRDRLNTSLMNLMRNLVATAVSSNNMFAAGNIVTWLYGMVQCTPDISLYDCNICLSESVKDIPNCCDGMQGAAILKPSCNIRYEMYPFYLFAAPAPPAPPSTNPSGDSSLGITAITAIVVSTFVFVVFFSTLCKCFVRWKERKKYHATKEEHVGDEIKTVRSLQFDLGTIEAATNKFSDDNKIGKGGFGTVYKGTLSNGQQIAVKRLSRRSRQRSEEFKNEVVVVAKLQHRNLVELLGFCLEGEEMMLIFEFLPNKSLDYFLFDPQKQRQLDWSRRYKIIQGVARGMLYLHEYSHPRIIHRDLKAGNVLLDGNMNPKISDFGAARIFRVDQTRESTNRIVGTYGYMSPEYAMRGQFSVKSDAFSFGVLILEIISGRRNNSFYHSDYTENLPSYAWKHWRDGTPLELMDPILTDSYSRKEVIRCIHIGLLCVQEDPADRPTMLSLVPMLNSLSVTPPLPHQPAFFVHGRAQSNMSARELESGQSRGKVVPLSVNEASITELNPR